MKVKLVVASGVHEGREIPIAGNQFMIGRDPQCQLRPSSPAISKRHCGIFVRGGKVFVRDYGSTNGTFVNGQALQGEIEVSRETALKIGPLDFKLVVEAPAKAEPLPTPAPAKAKPKAADGDDDFAAFLLEGDSGPANVPEGSTVMEMNTVNPDTGEPIKKPEPPKPDPKKGEGDTRSAAADILRQYQRRPRS